MRIIFTVAFAKGYGSGVGTVAYEIAEYFSKFHDVVLICPGEKFCVSHSANGLKTLSIPSAGQAHALIPKFDRKNIQSLYEFLKDFRPDIIHAHEPTSISFISQIWALKNNVPFIFTAHVLLNRILDFGAKDIAGFLKFRISEPVLNKYFLTFINNCDGVIALNKPVEESIRSVGYQGRIFNIPNGRSLSLYNACQVTINKKPPYFLTFIGSLVPRKNQAYLLEVMLHLPEDYILQLVGSSLNVEYEKELHDFCRAHNLDQRVVFMGEVEHNKIPELLGKTDFFISASKMEVQSLVILEALASGTPVIGIANETIDEFIDEQVGIKLPHSSRPQQFAQAILDICKLSPQAHLNMCLNARKKVSHLDWGNIMDATLMAYNELIHIEHIKQQMNKTHLSTIIKHMPLNGIREALMQNLQINSSSRISPSTSFFAIATVVLSFIGYLLVKAHRKAASTLRRP